MSESKYNLKSIVRKILAAFLLGSAAIVLAVSIARFSFRELVSTVDDLSTPSEKLTLLNTLFEKITTLDQVQRAEAISNPNKPFSTFLEQSVDINEMIDSLKKHKWNRDQLAKLDSMKGILDERNRLFFSYLKVKAELMENKEFSIQLDTLALILAADEMTFDSSLVQSQKKVTTTYFRDSTKKAQQEQQRSIFKRLFSKKKAVAVDTPKIKVREETSYVVDTVALSKQLAAVTEIEKIMKNMDMDQRNQRKRLQRQELELINANSQFINQLLNILHEVENEELAMMNTTNRDAVHVMNRSMSRINLLMLGFFLAAALLIYLIWIDIGKSNYYKEQLERARDRAEELSQIKQRFLANMSHEIRTPLQSIIGFAEQLKRKRKTSEEEVEAIYSSSEHLLHIVNEVLDYSRISSGSLTLAKEPFRLMQVIKEIEASMRVQAERKRITFLLDIEKCDCDQVLSGDAFRLKQILYNLLGNAIKFTHDGFVKLGIHSIEDGESLIYHFDVVDSGIGIAAGDLPKIFNQFEQANANITSHYGGTGLGLSIVKSLVEAQGGTIDVSSTPGKGTAFRIHLRFEKAAQQVGTKPLTQIPVMNTGSLSVIVIDDDNLILRLCGLILKKNNIDHMTFNSAKALIAHPVDQRITHIFMDIRMPDMNGVELCRTLRKKYPSSTQFVALTAHVLPEEKNNLLEQGFNAVLTKPFHENDLLGTLAENQTITLDDEQPDLSLLRKMTVGDEALFQSIIAQFIEETTEDVARVKTSMRHNDEIQLREVAHKMAGRFAQLGARKLSLQLQHVEKEVIAGSAVAELSDNVVTILANVDDMIKKIQTSALDHSS